MLSLGLSTVGEKMTVLSFLEALAKRRGGSLRSAERRRTQVPAPSALLELALPRRKRAVPGEGLFLFPRQVPEGRSGYIIAAVPLPSGVTAPLPELVAIGREYAGELLVSPGAATTWFLLAVPV